MRIILVATDVSRKSIVFFSDAGRILSLEETIRLIQAQTLKGAYVVHGKYGDYIRSLPNSALKDNLDTLSVSGRDIISYINQTKHAVSTPPISQYLEQYLASLDEGEPFITPIGQDKVLITDVKEKFIPHLSLITAVAEEFNIDRYLLGAILIDEIARMRPFEPIFDKLGATIVGLNVSVGIAQVKIDTANQLIKEGLYNPNPNDKKLPFSGILSNLKREYLYKYLIQPKYNIRFAAAFVRSLINNWAKEIDLSRRPEITITLYHLPYRKPHSKPVADERGNQVAIEFYGQAKKWLT